MPGHSSWRQRSGVWTPLLEARRHYPTWHDRLWGLPNLLTEWKSGDPRNGDMHAHASTSSVYFKHTATHAHTHIYVYIYIYIMCICICISICISICICICILYVSVCTNTCIHTRIHTYIHTYGRMCATMCFSMLLLVTVWLCQLLRLLLLNI